MIARRSWSLRIWPRSAVEVPRSVGGTLLRWLLIGFLIAHGLVHVAIWTPKFDPEKPRSTRRTSG
jgi:hypothetical protein